MKQELGGCAGLAPKGARRCTPVESARSEDKQDGKKYGQNIVQDHMVRFISSCDGRQKVILPAKGWWCQDCIYPILPENTTNPVRLIAIFGIPPAHPATFYQAQGPYAALCSKEFSSLETPLGGIIGKVRAGGSMPSRLPRILAPAPRCVRFFVHVRASATRSARVDHTNSPRCAAGRQPPAKGWGPLFLFSKKHGINQNKMRRN